MSRKGCAINTNVSGPGAVASQRSGSPRGRVRDSDGPCFSDSLPLGPPSSGSSPCSCWTESLPWGLVYLCVLTPRTVALQAPLSKGFPRQEYWSGLPFPFQGLFPTQGSNTSSVLAGRFVTTEPPEKPYVKLTKL